MPCQTQASRNQCRATGLGHRAKPGYRSWKQNKAGIPVLDTEQSHNPGIGLEGPRDRTLRDRHHANAEPVFWQTHFRANHVNSSEQYNKTCRAFARTLLGLTLWFARMSLLSLGSMGVSLHVFKARSTCWRLGAKLQQWHCDAEDHFRMPVGLVMHSLFLLSALSMNMVLVSL